MKDPFALLLRLSALLLAMAPTMGWGLDPSSSIAHYGHTSFKLVDGALPSEPYRVLQGQDGYLWIGTDTEVISFDGVRFAKKVAADPDTSAFLSMAFAAADGSLWLGSADGRLQRIRPDRQANTFTVPSGAPFAMLEDERGTLWVTTTRAPRYGKGGLCRVMGESLTCFNSDNGPLRAPTCCVTAIAQDQDRNFWLGTDISLIKWREGGPPTTYFPAALEHSAGIPGILSIVAEGNTVWAAIGLAGKQGGLQRVVDGKLQPFIRGNFDSSKISAGFLYLDRHHALWVGTDQDGIYRIYNEAVDHFGVTDGLSGGSVSSITEDRDGGLWVATPRGLDHFRDLRVETLSGADGLGAEQIYSMLQRRDGSTWIGTNAGLQVLRNGRVERLGKREGLAGSEVTAMFEAKSGDVWIGTDGMLHVYRRGRFHPVTDRLGHEFGLVKSIAEDSSGDIWLETNGAARRIVRLHADDVAETFESPEFPTVHRIAGGQDGEMWLALTDGRLGRLRHGKVEAISYDDMGPRHQDSDVIWQVEVDSAGRVLAASDFGLLGFDHGARRVLSARNGLPCTSVLQFLTDASGDLWLASNCGYTRIQGAELERWWHGEAVTVTPLTLGAQDGAGTPLATFADSGRLPDGRLAFGTTAGLQLIDPARVTRTAPPPVKIEAVTADRRPYKLGSRVVLPKRSRDVEIDYTAFNFNLAKTISFRYRLDDYDGDWQAAGFRRQAFYSNLPPGQYRFAVSSSTGDGVWSDQPATLEFVIPPAYFQTRWFVALMVLAAALLLSILFNWRMREMKARMRARLEGRITERERIARELHDTLLQGVQGLILKFQDAAEEMPHGTVARGKMDAALDRADDVLMESRDRVKDLRIARAVPLDLASEIAARGADLAKQQATTFESTVQGTARPVKPIVAEEMIRIADEALANAFRHARATRIETEIIYSATSLRLRVRDDGCGIEEPVLRVGRPDHWGLPGMRERARKIHARLEVWSRLGAGTEVELRVPARVAFGKPRRWLFARWLSPTHRNNPPQDLGEK